MYTSVLLCTFFSLYLYILYIYTHTCSVSDVFDRALPHCAGFDPMFILSHCSGSDVPDTPQFFCS